MGKIYSADQVSRRIESIVVVQGESSPSYKETLCGPKYQMATLIGCTLSLFQQLTGINIVMFYSSNILTSTGLAPNLVTALVGFVNCVSVFPTIILFKKFGRKILLWTLSFAIAISLIGLGVALIVNAQYKENNHGVDSAVCQALQVVFLMLFIIFFEFSLGPLLWIYMSEIMTEKGLSLGVGVNQTATVIVAFFTSALIDVAGKGSGLYPKDVGSGRLFVGCGVITALCGVFCLLVLKETKGLSEREVSALY
jgi:SP family facilitated glucose transporter-like MFS transporter 1